MNFTDLTVKCALNWASEDDALFGKVKVVMMRMGVPVATYHVDAEFGENITFELEKEEDGIHFIKNFRGGDWFSI